MAGEQVGQRDAERNRRIGKQRSAEKARCKALHEAGELSNFNGNDQQQPTQRWGISARPSAFVLLPLRMRLAASNNPFARPGL